MLSNEERCMYGEAAIQAGTPDHGQNGIDFEGVSTDAGDIDREEASYNAGVDDALEAVAPIIKAAVEWRSGGIADGALAVELLRAIDEAGL